MNTGKEKTPNDIYSICTQLREIYGKDKKEYIEEKIEPVYESMRTKFRNAFENSEPSFYIRVPYAQVLLGDSITGLFDDKIITTIEKDLILCGNTLVNDKSINIELFDKYGPRIKYDIESDDKGEEYPVENIKYIISAYMAGVNNVKPKVKKGINLLINFNIPNSSIKDCYVSCFIATFFAALHVHNGIKLFSKQSLFDLCYNEINKIDNFINYSGIIYFQMYLEKNSIGLQSKHEYKQIKVDPDDSILISDSFSSYPPMMISKLNFWNKRKVEFKLGLALILKRYKKNFTSEDILDIAKDFKTFTKYFENNLETIFELIE